MHEETQPTHPGVDAAPERPEAGAAPAPAAAAATAETDFADAAAPAAVDGPAPAGPEDPEAPVDLDALRAERDEYLALAQRKQAEFENFRKRMTRENAAAVDRGVSKLAAELLGALDHLELALRAAEAEGGALYDGVRIVQQELLGGLARVGIQAFDPKGEPFDPNEHEAMVQQPVEGAESGTVVETYQQGYRSGAGVLRPARVVVAA
jgi:molecular chaperone GrpE